MRVFLCLGYCEQRKVVRSSEFKGFIRRLLNGNKIFIHTKSIPIHQCYSLTFPCRLHALITGHGSACLNDGLHSFWQRHVESLDEGFVILKMFPLALYGFPQFITGRRVQGES